MGIASSFIRILEQKKAFESSGQISVTPGFTNGVPNANVLMSNKLGFHELVYLIANLSNDTIQEIDDIVRGAQAKNRRHSKNISVAMIGPSAPLYGLVISRRLSRSIARAFEGQQGYQKHQIRSEYWILQITILEEMLDKDAHIYWPNREEAENHFEVYFAHFHTRQPLGLEEDEIFANYRKGP